jgi:hypothetical protein
MLCRRRLASNSRDLCRGAYCIPRFTGFVLSHIDHLATPNLSGCSGCPVSDEPSVSTFLHSWNLLDAVNSLLFEIDKEMLIAAVVLLYSISERGCL